MLHVDEPGGGISLATGPLEREETKMSRFSTRTLVVTGAAAIALVAAGTVAGAAITAGPVDSSGVVHGCYGQANTDGTTHDVVLQNAGTTCPANMTPITWNQTGPQGQAGPTGATGPVGAAGPAGPAGAAGPVGPAGSMGDTGAAGPAGPAGATGPAGNDGNTVLSGTGAPASTAGSDGDFYIDTAADVLYGPKAGGTWPAVGTSLIGPAGPQGPTGPQGATGPQGPAGPANITAKTDFGFVIFGAGGKTVISLSVPGGSYLITAKVVLESSAASGPVDSVNCNLVDPSQNIIDSTPAELVADSNGIGEETIMLSAGSGTSGGSYSVECSDTLNKAAALDMTMSAIQA